MKNITLLFLLFITSLNFAKAQTDYCKEIIPKVDKELAMTSYDSPGTFLTIGKNRLDDGTFGPITLRFVGFDKTADYEAYGLYATFSDGTIWRDGGKHINCSYQGVDAGYRFGAVKIMDEDMLLLFKTKKLVKVRIHNIEIPVDETYATRFISYVNCIVDLK